MFVQAGDLKPEGLQLELHPQIGPLDYEGGQEIGVAAAALKARLIPARGGMKCAGRFVATAFVPCSRCLEPYALPVDREFDLIYLPEPGEAGPEGMELQISRDDLDVAFLDPDGRLDVNNLVAEQIYLSLPMKPLCGEGCRGLCPGCGTNLNLETCRCEATART